MYRFETKIRVRYGETDQMGYVYYGNYALYYEVARVESLRYLGLTYKEIEEGGVLLPILETSSKFILPATYDEELKIVAFIREKPTVRLKFEYEIYNDQQQLIHLGETRLAFIDKGSKKPCKPPKILQDLLQPYFSQ